MGSRSLPREMDMDYVPYQTYGLMSVHFCPLFHESRCAALSATHLADRCGKCRVSDGLLTPFYFVRAGTLVSLPALLAAPLVFLALLMGKVASKIFGLYPFTSLFRQDRKERWYSTLLMSTGLTFGTISSLYGLTHGLVTQEQYSFLVAAVIASAVVPTVIAGAAFPPTHLLTTVHSPDKTLSSAQ